MDAIVKKCKTILEKYYGTRFTGFVLYGSMARNAAEPESDIDLLVLLTGPLDYFAELRIITDILYPVQIESERLISVKPVSVEEYENGGLQLYRNARQEGVAV